MHKQLHVGTDHKQQQPSHTSISLSSSLKCFPASLGIPKPIAFLLGLTKVGRIKDMEVEEATERLVWMLQQLGGVVALTEEQTKGTEGFPALGTCF